MFKSRSEGNVVYKCTVRLLEDADVLECEFQPHHKGIFLLEYICEQLEIAERDYFGLRYVDSTKQRHWLDLAKSIIKQVKDVDPVLFSFRVKFYPADPFRLTNNGKFMFYQQLKRDLRHGRLYCSSGEAAALGALIVQEEIGDYDSDLHAGDYVSSLRLALRQTDQLERKIIDLHQKREPGQDPSGIPDEFIGIARGLETYGIDPHPVKDHRGTQQYLGINYSGISTFAAGRRAQHFRWPEVHKLNYEGKMFIAHLSYTDASREPKKHTIGFKCPTGSACRYVWRCAIEQMLFFTLPNSQNASVMSGGGFFSWGTKFRYSGRTEREILNEGINALRQQQLTNNTTPSKRKANSVPATPSSPQGDLAAIRYSSLPRSTMSEPPCSDQLSSAYCPESALPLLETVSEEARRHAENLDHMSDYYFRDSFDHSSSESGLTSLTDSRMVNMLGGGGVGRQYSTSDNMSSLQQQQQHGALINNTTNLINQQNATNTSRISNNGTGNHGLLGTTLNNNKNNIVVNKKFSLLHAFVPSFIFVVILLIITTIFILESDSDIFVTFKNWPEMLCLRYQYYQPLKEFLYKKLQTVFNF